MTASNDLQRRVARHYESEPPMRAPDWVLQSALSTIESTPQRRGLATLRRYPAMPKYLKFAAAAALAIALGGVAVWQLGPGGPGGRPDPTASPSASPSAAPTAAPTSPPAPTSYVPGAPIQTFTSSLHGFSLKYPEGWTAQPATEPWTEGDPPIASEPTGDKLFDGAFEDHLLLTVASRPLDGVPLDQWLASYLAGCTPTASGTINGADRVLRFECAADHADDIALTSSGGRGYVFELRVSRDDTELQALDTAALLDAILATVELRPDDAVDG